MGIDETPLPQSTKDGADGEIRVDRFDSYGSQSINCYFSTDLEIPRPGVDFGDQITIHRNIVLECKDDKKLMDLLTDFMEHEFLHFLGQFSHSTRKESLMYKSLGGHDENWNIVNIRPRASMTQHDMDVQKAIHLAEEVCVTPDGKTIPI